MRFLPRRLAWRLRFPLGLAGLIAAVLYVPFVPWRPACDCTPVEGDLRDVYVDAFTDYLRQRNVFYLRFGDLVLLRFKPWLIGIRHWGQDPVVYNTECKLADSLSDDATIDGVFHPAPPLATRLKRELAPVIGPDYRFRPDGSERYHGSDWRVGYCCPLFRAAVLEPGAEAGDPLGPDRWCVRQPMRPWDEDYPR